MKIQINKTYKTKRAKNKLMNKQNRTAERT